MRTPPNGTPPLPAPGFIPALFCSLHTATNKSVLTDSNYFNFFILNGTYDDFSPEWYNNVGLSIQVGPDFTQSVFFSPQKGVRSLIVF